MSGFVRATARVLLPSPLRRQLRRLLMPDGEPAQSVSSGYEAIDPGAVRQVSDELGRAWQDPSIPAEQWALVESELRRYDAGESFPTFDVFVDMISRIPEPNRRTLLEVGCSAGHYADVLSARNVQTIYTGCDYSESFVARARARLPRLAFDLQDATHLEYADASYDVVVSGCCILHIADYPAAIRESARVARKYVLFHRTPVLHTSPTTYYRKRAYGVQCLEIHFNETELLQHFHTAGLRVADIQTISVGGHAPPGDVHLIKSYLCERT